MAMAEISIRNVPDDIYQALKEKATADGKGLETWIREQLTLLTARPTVRKRYKFTALGENGAKITIERRWPDSVPSRGAKNCSQEQFDAYEKAALLCERNEPGDYEKAYQLLLGAFDEVFAL